MGMVKFMDDADKGEVKDENYNFQIAASADEVTPKLVQGELDIAAVPANLASVLYNNTDGKVQVLAINTLGVLYIVENGDTVQSVADLKGKTIYASERVYPGIRIELYSDGKRNRSGIRRDHRVEE